MEVMTKDCFLILLGMLWVITMEAMGHIHHKDMDIHHKGTRLLAILRTVDTHPQDILLLQAHTRHLHILRMVDILLQATLQPTIRVIHHIMDMDLIWEVC